MGLNKSLNNFLDMERVIVSVPQAHENYTFTFILYPILN